MGEEASVQIDDALRAKVHDISEILVRQQFGGLEGNVSLPLNKVNTIKTANEYYDTCVFADVLGAFTNLPESAKTSGLETRDRSVDELVGDLHSGSELIMVVRKNSDSLFEGHSYHFNVDGELLAYQKVELANNKTWQPVKYLGQVPDEMKPQVYKLLDESLDRVSANYKLVKDIEAFNARQTIIDTKIEKIKQELDSMTNDFHKEVGVSTDIPYNSPKESSKTVEKIGTSTEIPYSSPKEHSTIGQIGVVSAIGLCAALMGYVVIKAIRSKTNTSKEIQNK